MCYLIVVLCLVFCVLVMVVKIMEWDDLVFVDYDFNVVYEWLFSDIYGD